MESLGGEIAYPTLEQICEVNRRMIQTYGGSFDPPYNLRNAESLEYILVAISSSVFSVELYPALKDKAAALAFHIITRHVFHDGNKRTGSQIAWEFLRANGVNVFLEPSIVELTVAIAKNESTQGELLRWLHDHQ